MPPRSPIFFMDLTVGLARSIPQPSAGLTGVGPSRARLARGPAQIVLALVGDGVGEVVHRMLLWVVGSRGSRLPVTGTGSRRRNHRVLPARIHAVVIASINGRRAGSCPT